MISAAKSEMIKSKLPNNVLGKIWKLSDVDKDGEQQTNIHLFRSSEFFYIPTA